MLKGCKKVSKHLVCAVKIDLMQNARQILDSYKNSVSKSLIYTGVILRKSMRITFTYTTFNDINICIANKKNIYL